MNAYLLSNNLGFPPGTCYATAPGTPALCYKAVKLFGGRGESVPKVLTAIESGHL
jgi:hypothetical protein